MFYQLTKKGLNKNISKISKRNKYFIYIKLQDLDQIKNIFNIDKLKYEFDNLIHNKLEFYENYLFFFFNIKSIKNISKITGKLSIIITKNIILIVNIDNSKKIDKLIINTINSIKKDYTVYHILSNLIDQLLIDSFEQLQYINNKIINIEKEVFSKEIHDNLNPLIFSIKKEVLNYKTYFECLLNLINNIELAKDNKYLNQRINKLNSLLDYTKTLFDNTIHLRDIYQSHLDFYQNRVIKILTISTTIFLPLTLITSWYGMNLKHMPEIEYEYSYPIIIGICLSFIIVCYIIFKRKKII